MIGIAMSGGECLLRTLAINGVRVCFMNPGTSEMHMVAALDRVAGVRGVLCLFEGVCSGAADGYARMTGRAAATLLHLGPGLANGLSNFHNARKANSAVVSIVGEHSTQHLKYDAPLSADIAAFARTVTDEVRTPRCASELGSVAADAIAAAMHPPGRVSMLIVSADHCWSDAGQPGGRAPVAARRVPDPEPLRKLLHKDTGLLLSGTALSVRGLEAAGRIAAQTGVRVYANRNAARMASGLGRFQPQRIPYFPEPALSVLAGLRHLITVEAKPPVSFFGYPGTPSYLAPEHCEVHVLADLAEDGAAALEALAGGYPPLRPENRTAPSLPVADGPLTLNAIGRTLAALLPENAIISDEMVSSSEPIWTHLLDAAPHDHLPVTGGSIGQGLPVALGAAIACPERKVVALEADGSAMYTLQALWTMARERLDVTTVVFANRRYRILDIEMQRTGVHGFGPRAGEMIDIGDPALDFVKLSEGSGVEASRAATVCEFAAQFGVAMRERGPRLIEAVLA